MQEKDAGEMEKVGVSYNGRSVALDWRLLVVAVTVIFCAGMAMGVHANTWFPWVEVVTEQRDMADLKNDYDHKIDELRQRMTAEQQQQKSVDEQLTSRLQDQTTATNNLRDITDKLSMQLSTLQQRLDDLPGPSHMRVR